MESLKRVRKARGLSLADVAARAGLFREAIARLERPQRSSSGTSKLAPAILLAVALPLEAGSFHSETRGENAQREQRKEPAPADSAARLNRPGDELRVEPSRVPARRQCQLGTFNGAAPRPQRAKER